MRWIEVPGAVCAPKGFRASSAYAGIRKAKKDDLTLIVSDTEAQAAGVLTTNQVHAWCVAHNRERLKSGRAQAIVCNAGNANACNGRQGKNDDLAIASSVAKVLAAGNAGVLPADGSALVLTASTGVIGVSLPISSYLSTLPRLLEDLSSTPESGNKAASSIMTTDLVSKSIAIEFELDGKKARIGAIAKGSGMIAPNMATMLCFITTDVEIDSFCLQEALSHAVNRSFNCISVDGDTSTNDMVLALANGQSGARVKSDPKLFEEALLFVCRHLAKAIAADGEGATKLVTIRLLNPPENGRQIAKTIAESPLVKTACFGNDPNWGRIVAAAGRSGVSFDPLHIVVRLAGLEVFKNGEPTSFDSSQVSRAMKSKELCIELEFLGPLTGYEPVTCWTCDLSYDYVRINADYGT